MNNKETVTNVGTTTTTTTKGNLCETNPVFPRGPVFLIFAEYIGYTSPLIKLAERYCKGEIKNLNIYHCLERDAESIFHKMLEDYSDEDIRYWWDMFYEMAIEEFDMELTKHCDDLPF